MSDSAGASKEQSGDAAVRNREQAVSTRPSLPRRFVYALVVLIAVFGGLEVALRVIGFRFESTVPPLEFLAFEDGAASLTFVGPDPRLFWSMRPSTRIPQSVVLGVEMTNSFGMRGVDIPRDKRDGEIRVALLGDSCTFGLGVPLGRTWGAAFERRLRAVGRDVTVINAGVPGYSSLQCVRRFERDVLPLAPDIAVLYAGQWNDFTPAVGSADHLKDIERAIPEPATFGGLRTLQAIARVTEPVTAKLRARRAARYRAEFEEGELRDGERVPQERFRSNVERFVLLARSRDIEPVLLLGPAPAETKRWFPISAYHNVMRDVALRYSVILVDPRQDLQREGVDSDLFYDWIHPSALGHRVLARRLYHALTNEFESKLRDPTLQAFEAVKARDTADVRRLVDVLGRADEGAADPSSVVLAEDAFLLAAGSKVRLVGSVGSSRSEGAIRLDAESPVFARVRVAGLDEPIFEGTVEGTVRLRSIQFGSFCGTDIHFDFEVGTADGGTAGGLRVGGEIVEYP